MSEHPYSDRDFLTLGIGANIELSGPDFPDQICPQQKHVIYTPAENTLYIPTPENI